MSNFAFIPSSFTSLGQTPIEAEQYPYSAPLYCAMLCRKSLEEWVRWIYQHDQDLQLPYDTSLSALIHDHTFKNLIGNSLFCQINLVRKLGNTAVHENSRIEPVEALHALQILHSYIAWVTAMYAAQITIIAPFNESLVPQQAGADKSRAELLELEQAYHFQQVKLEKLEAELESIKAIKEQNSAFVPPPIDPNEDLTRKMYIDTLLREAKWDPFGRKVAEYPVFSCMPLANGLLGDGFVDYVLWGNDGKPLAIVEAKRTRISPEEGKHQAKYYANALEKEFGQRPVIFYSNGFNTWLWDDVSYPPRQVHGFYTKDELQLLIQRRQYRKDLTTELVNTAIVDRPYQHEAIRRFTEMLTIGNREGLLVMATGTGKTRVAAAIIDLLSKAGWVKRVLFLADRNALVTQAKINLNNYLPNLPAVDLTQDKEDESSRIVFSTYQTIINMIDGEVDGNNKFYTVGHFDLIIFDEIHRSVYNSYRHIFKYFDGFRLGLTATPRSESHKDTYGLFGLQPGVPTFAYELTQAVEDEFLVAPVAIGVPVKFQRQGIKYADLSPDEKLAYEEEFADPITGEYPDEIDSGALNKWLFNTDTVDKVLSHVMQQGIKVESGDKLAKTIIFARNHNHAVFIEQRFDANYPQYKGTFLSVIDNQESKRYALLNDFKDPKKNPQIAVSVDMLDTGIDVPEVCNLVFFKPVRSSTKYWQMVGRGTRLCKDLFAIGQDKKEFIIFDFCENFEFFENRPRGIETPPTISISQRLFQLRLRLSHILLHQDDPASQEHGQSLLNFLIQQTQALNTNSFIVRQHWDEVEKYKDPNSWNSLSDLDIQQLITHIAPLLTEINEDERAKRFDALMLDLEIAILTGEKSQVALQTKVASTAAKLSKKASIPSVANQMATIKEVQTKTFWEAADIIGLERVRTELRDLLKFLDGDSTPIFYTTFEDEYHGETKLYNLIAPSTDLEAYKRKVEQYFREQQHHLTIHKLRTNVPITQSEVDELQRMLFAQGSVGTQQEFTRLLGQQPLGVFIRTIIGLDINAAKLAFGEILQNQTLNAQQIKFIDTIINYLSVKGIIDPAMLFETSPFTDINSLGVSGLFDDNTSAVIISLIEKINSNANVG